LCVLATASSWRRTVGGIVGRFLGGLLGYDPLDATAKGNGGNGKGKRKKRHTACQLNGTLDGADGTWLIAPVGGAACSIASELRTMVIIPDPYILSYSFAPNRRSVVVVRSISMDGSRVATLSRALAAAHSRRGLSRLLGAVTLAGSWALLGLEMAEAKRRKKKRKKKTGAAPTTSPPPPPPPPPPRVVISQIFTRGGGVGGAFNRDYIELFNRETTPVTLNNWSVQFASSIGTTWNTTPITGLTMPPGAYLLVGGASGGANGAALPQPDVDGNLTLLDGGGRVALVTATTPLSCGADPSCVTAPGVIDFLGYGTGGATGEGGAPAPEPGASGDALFRDGSGCTDTNNNALDFSLADPAPRNSATTPFPCN
jgi:hypothetical protein